MSQRTRVLALFLAGLGLGSSGCGYSLAGRGAFLPEYIRAIGVPVFTNHTTVFDVEQVISEKVRSEFIGRGRYRVLPETTGVDATLEGEISEIKIEPATFTGQQQASRYVLTLTAKIVFRDLKNDKVLWQNSSLTFKEEYDVATGGGVLDVNAFFGQERNALERVAIDFAKTVVSSILEAF